jgi:hypothetical protein
MAKFKDFGAGPDTTTVEAPTFQIHGETFECIKAVQGKVLLQLVADSGSSDPVVQSAIIDKFFSHVLTEESLGRFNTLLTDKYKIVTVETLGEITGWLIEEYSERPEEQPEA